MCTAVDHRSDFLRDIWACDDGWRADRNRRGKCPETEAAFFAVSFTVGTVADTYKGSVRREMHIERNYSASITVEASMVLSVVLLSMAAFYPICLYCP